MSSLEEEYTNLAQEISRCSSSDGVPKVEAFFNIYSELAAENGDCPDLEYSPILSGRGYRLDGYSFDIPEDTEGSSGDLYIAVCSYSQNDKLPVLNSKDIDKVVSKVEQFLKLSLSEKSLEELEEASPDFKLAMLIREAIKKIARVRVIVFTNAHLQVRKKIFEPKSLGKITVHTNVFDIDRYSRISSTGNDPVEVDFIGDFPSNIPCLQASGSSEYKSYLFAIPATILADIFAEYGNRLLEQNVRTYLQAKTSVNKGILKTLRDEPSMFFAYNNGLTATASYVNISSDGCITHIKDFQIVNGGQTTASILYARDGGMKCDLLDVFAQVKLSVVDGSKIADIVPNISKYANTQNKVSVADLESNSAIQIKIERLSKEVVVPQKVGSLFASKWFYERARGQFKNLSLYKSASQRKKIEAEYPKSQLIEKTDLAKFELSFDGQPHFVSEGAQKCFNRYVTSSLKISSDSNDLNETWFKCAVAKGILFRNLDKRISLSEWYKNQKGLKSQTVTYTVAACAHSFRDIGLQIDLLRIWKEQDVPLNLSDWMLKQAEFVSGILSTPKPGENPNIAQLCKSEFFWTRYVKGKVSLLEKQIQEYGVPLMDFADELSHGKGEGRRNKDIDFEISLAKLVPKAAEIRLLAESRKLISENNNRALKKLEAGKIGFTKSEKNSLKTLLERLEINL